MVIRKSEHLVSRWLFIFFMITSLVIIVNFRTAAQEMPPKPVTIDYIQSLSFGAFSLGLTIGTVTVSTSGIRTYTGGIILLGLGFPFYPAIFDMEGNPGTVIHPMLGSDVLLSGSNGGSLTLHLDNTDPGDPIIVNVAPPGYVPVKVGGTLYVGSQAANPPGYYTGTFSIMFIQE
jgi:hypothetical protein